MEILNHTACQTIEFPSIHEGDLILVNPDHPLRAQPRLLSKVLPANNQVLLEDHVARPLMELLDRIGAREQILCFEGYRSRAEQLALYQNSVVENGPEYTEKFVALPGCSEHESGLAIDLALNQETIDPICPSFPDIGICQIFRHQAESAGFIERYKEEKKELTTISGEEWHFRYVGIPHAMIMSELGFCLEEYIEFLHDYPLTSNPLHYEGWTIGYVSADEPLPKLNPYQEVSISGDNINGWIVTCTGKLIIE